MIGELIDVLLMNKRSIGGIIPNVILEENHTDTLEITRHPVQRGAAITDHAYSNPAELTMRMGFSNSSSFLNSLLSGSLFSSPITDVSDIYQKFLDLQDSRVLLDVVTGKRTYSNMLIKSLATTTDIDSEYALMITAILQEVIIVDVQTTTAGVAVPTLDQLYPENTGPVLLAGTKQAADAAQPELNSIASDIGIV